MARKDTKAGCRHKSHSHKTKKRLEIKRRMLALKANKHHK